MSALETVGPVAPTQDDSEIARESSHQLARLLGGLRPSVSSTQPPEPVRIEIHFDSEHEVVSLPATALQLLNHILTQMAEGNAVTIIPTECELTTQQAADILNVSRPFLIGLIERREIPCRKVGTHRRVLLSDVMAYKNGIDEKRRAVLEELAAQAQELEMGY